MSFYEYNCKLLFSFYSVLLEADLAGIAIESYDGYAYLSDEKNQNDVLVYWASNADYLSTGYLKRE